MVIRMALMKTAQDAWRVMVTDKAWGVSIDCEESQIIQRVMAIRTALMKTAEDARRVMVTNKAWGVKTAKHSSRVMEAESIDGSQKDLKSDGN